MTAVPDEQVLAAALADAEDPDVFGGKAAQLGQAIRGGLPVPGGCALSPGLVEAVARGSDAAVDVLARAIEGLGLSAVRSSALDEDTSGASFAGAHLSVLAVTGLEATVAAVRAVHASGQEPGARGYRTRLGLDLTARMAVVVQRLVEADTAGVLFTRNPVTGADERLVEATWGLGEAVVSGLVTPDSYRVARGGRPLARVPGDKDVAVRRTRGPGGGTEEVPVPAELAGVLCLGDRELAALDALATRCDGVYGSTRHDIEFAFHGGELFLLQRRPMTGA